MTKQDLLNSTDARIAHEVEKNADNVSIVKTLTVLRKALDVDAIANVLIAANVNADFLNKSERTNARFNVYAAEKVVNVARASCKATSLNHYTLAILRAANALKSNELMLTHADAVAACSLDIKHADTKRAAIIKSARYAKHVAANTAATQSSSSINALQTCNVLTETRDERNAVSYTLADNDLTRDLLALAAQ